MAKKRSGKRKVISVTKQGKLVHKNSKKTQEEIKKDMGGLSKRKQKGYG